MSNNNNDNKDQSSDNEEREIDNCADFKPVDIFNISIVHKGSPVVFDGDKQVNFLLNSLTDNTEQLIYRIWEIRDTLSESDLVKFSQLIDLVRSNLLRCVNKHEH